ncbi:hypothetical protein Ciccas_011678 [Cichlidogyrus casuarinus]|uniref:DAAF9 N-terminal domain-containing protein n=1 Tax=Cichlidogyrus casuarinus TaxID=1844966 RepID=A0ABD2PS98_9PLAT
MFYQLNPGPESDFDFMHFEEWPLIQSYALDINRNSSRTFFTLEKQIINITEDMCDLLTAFNCATAISYLSNCHHLLLNSFHQFLDNVDLLLADPATRTSNNPLQSLITFFHHGHDLKSSRLDHSPAISPCLLTNMDQVVQFSSNNTSLDFQQHFVINHSLIYPFRSSGSALPNKKSSVYAQS